MGREVGDLAEQPGVKEDQVPPVVDAQVSIPARPAYRSRSSTGVRRRPRVIAEVCRSIRRRADVPGVGVLMHVEDHVHALAAGPAYDLRDALQVRLAEPSWLRLEQAPRKWQAHRVESEGRHLRDVVL